MTKFTRGPWSVICEKGDPSFSALVATTNGCGWAIDCTESGKTPEESVANARLIAAAPDLYEALQTLLDAVEGNHITVGDCNQARAALKKAEGKS